MKFANALKFNVLAAALIAATLSVGDAHAQRGKDKEKAEEAYPDATRESPEAKNTPRLAKDIQKMFDLYNEGEDLEGAIAIAEKLLANERAKAYDRGIALMIAGNAALGIDDYPRAIPYLERALQENSLPNNNHFATMHTLASVYARKTWPTSPSR